MTINIIIFPFEKHHDKPLPVQQICSESVCVLVSSLPVVLSLRLRNRWALGGWGGGSKTLRPICPRLPVPTI